MSPAARKLLEEFNISSPESVPATGPHGTISKGYVLYEIVSISKGDVLKYVDLKKLTKVNLADTQQPPKPSTPSKPPSVISPQPITPPPFVAEGGFKDIDTTGMRRTIAKRLTEAKTTIPHSYVSMECNVDPASNIRKKFKDDGVKVSLNDFIVKAAAYSLQKVPKVNSLWKGEDLELQTNIDVSIAVATDQGLITPIELASKAREGKLQLHEFQGGSFTISNLGMFGIGEFSAVINPPQTAILAVGSSIVGLSVEGKPQTNMTVTLSYDRRAIDESEASQFLEVFKGVIENPSLLLVL